MNRYIYRILIRSKICTLVFIVSVCLMLTLATKVHTHVFRHFAGKEILRQSNLRTTERSLVVLVLSKRESFDRRKAIRSTWASGHNNVFFVVSEQHCSFPPENHVLDKCIQSTHPVTQEQLKTYLEKEEKITRKLSAEPDVILVPSRDNDSELLNKVKESFSWALRYSQAKWFLHMEDTMSLEVDKLEDYLKTKFYRSKNSVILFSSKPESLKRSGSKNQLPGKFQCGLNHIVSRCVAHFAVNRLDRIFEYTHGNSSKVKIADSLNITSERYENVSFISSERCNMSTSVRLDLGIKQQIHSCLESDSVKTMTSQKRNEIANELYENPSIYLQSYRFDLLVKMVYAHFYAYKKQVPKVIEDAYKEHIKVWNNFKEYCKIIKKSWYDSKTPCNEKRGSSAFISSFHDTINAIKINGFNSTLSRIPVDNTGFILNGAHRLSATIVLSKSAAFEHQKYTEKINWNYEFFKQKGLSVGVFDITMLEWMKIQLQLPFLKTFVSIVSVFSNNPRKDNDMRKIVKEECSKDKGIVYEKTVEFTKHGVRQLITHMYGQQSWLETKIKHMLSKFTSPTLKGLFIFIYGKETQDLLKCKEKIRKLYNDKIFKSTVHIPDNPEENLILAEMILNPNSLHFMNHAKDAPDCKRIAGEIALRTNTPEIRTLPTMRIGRDDIMVDSGTVLGFFGLRKRTDVDILFLQKVDKSILGNSHELNLQAHAFKFNSISKERAWGEDHFCKDGPKNEWDLFYDPKNFGYCYGIKFVSLKQLIRYKQKRNEPKKDQYDVGLINEFLKSVGKGLNVTL